LVRLKALAFFKVSLALSLVWFLLITSAPLVRFCVQPLESRYPVFQWRNHADLKVQNPAIVVLGAGHSYDTALLATHQLSYEVRGRLIEGYRIYRKAPIAHLITSGPNTNDFISHGKVVANAAVQLGVNPHDTSFISKGYKTRTEAKVFSKRFPNQDTVIVATDALHKRRALFWFRHYGLTPTPAPTNFKIRIDAYDPDPWLSFSIVNIDRLRKAIHEYVGYWYALWQTK